ncbi:MAG: MFS transporter, partial [Thermodesulfobacteriota bacterium]
GPVVSGFLLEIFSWRAIFLVTLPLSLSVFFYFSLVILPKLETIQQNNLQQHQFDLKGFLSWSTFIGLTVVLITNHQAFSRIVIALGVIALFFLFVSFLWIETHTKNPLLPLNLFENRNFVIGISCATFSFAVLFVVLILMPFYLDTVLKFQPQKIGMMMMAVPLLVFAVSPVSGRLYDRYGAKVLTTSGLALSMSALGLLCFLGPETGFWYIFISLSILGCGQALFLSPNSAALLMEGDAHHSGIVSGLLATSRNMGMLAGVSLGGLVFGLVFAANSGGLDIRDYTGGLENEFIRALRYTFIGTALLSGAAMVLSWQRSS